MMHKFMRKHGESSSDHEWSYMSNLGGITDNTTLWRLCRLYAFDMCNDLTFDAIHILPIVSKILKRCGQFHNILGVFKWDESWNWICTETYYYGKVGGLRSQPTDISKPKSTNILLCECYPICWFNVLEQIRVLSTLDTFSLRYMSILFPFSDRWLHEEMTSNCTKDNQYWLGVFFEESTMDQVPQFLSISTPFNMLDQLIPLNALSPSCGSSIWTNISPNH